MSWRERSYDIENHLSYIPGEKPSHQLLSKLDPILSSFFFFFLFFNFPFQLGVEVGCCRLKPFCSLFVSLSDKQLTERVTQDNGEWKIKRIYEEDVTTVTERRANSAQKYSLVKYTLEIERKPLYYVMLLILPCVLCTMLVLISFSIPPENGERIGFCSTVMISVSVYLLIMADLLPEKSDTLPILGIYYSITLVEIALAIMATILVLRAYHSASDPPACFKALYRMRKTKRKKEIKSSNKWKMKKILTRNAVASDNTTAGSEADPTCQAPVPVDPEQKPVILTDVNQEITDDDNRKIWRSIAVMWDRIFFWLFLLMFLGSTGYLMKFRPVFTF